MSGTRRFGLDTRSAAIVGEGLGETDGLGATIDSVGWALGVGEACVADGEAEGARDGDGDTEGFGVGEATVVAVGAGRAVPACIRISET